MYELMVEDSFSAAHRLIGYDGECATLHGHNFKVQVFFKAESLNSIGLAIDLRYLKDKLKGVLRGLDHEYLNEVIYFKDKNPSLENLARFIYEEFSRDLEGIILSEVRVFESETSYVAYKS